MLVSSGPRGLRWLAPLLCAGAWFLLAGPAPTHAAPLLQSDYQSYRIGPEPRLVACGDFDGDGYDDVAVVDADGMVTCHARGDGTLEPPRAFDAPADPVALLVVGHERHKRSRLGVVLRHGGGATVEVDVYNRVGFERSSTPVVVTFDRASDQVTVADLDGDGVPDLLATDGEDSSVTVAYARKNGEFDTPVRYDAGMAMGQVLAGDIDGDGRPEIVVLNGGPGLIGVLPNRGHREFGAPVRIPTNDTFGEATAGDFNGDGRCDLVLDSSILSGAGIRMWYANRTGTLTSHGDVAIQKSGAKLVAVDLNRDGRMDLIAGIGPDVLIGGPVALDPPARVAWGTVHVQDLATGDVDGDGIPDLAVVDGVPGLFCALSGETFPQSSLHVWRGVGDGTFDSTPSYPAPGTFAQPILADLDGDGLADLVDGSFDGGANGVTSWRGRPDGTFDTPIGIALDGTVGAIAAADFDGDGAPQLAVTYTMPNYFQGKLALLKLRPDRTLAARADTWVGATPARIAVADLNGDGRPDVVVSNRRDRSLSILLAGSTFGAWVESTLISARLHFAIAAADLDHDGIVDLAVTSDASVSGARSLFHYRGLGAGRFALADSIDLPERASSVRCIDVDGDGRVDLVLALSTGICPFDRDVVRILPNMGRIRFGPPVDAAMDDGPQDATLADLTGDGIPDLVAATVEGRVSVRPGLGGFRFGDLARFGTSKGRSNTVRVADLDRDGRIDVITNDRDDVSVLMNRGGFPRSGERMADHAQISEQGDQGGSDGRVRSTGPHAAVSVPRLTAATNPVVGDAEFAFDLDLPGPESDVRVSLYDVAGRRLGFLEHGPLRAGRNRLVWSAGTGATRPAPGLYFARVMLESGTLTARALALP